MGGPRKYPIVYIILIFRTPPPGLKGGYQFVSLLFSQSFYHYFDVQEKKFGYSNILFNETDTLFFIVVIYLIGLLRGAHPLAQN